MKDETHTKKIEARIVFSKLEMAFTVTLESPSDMRGTEKEEDGVVDEVTGKIIPFSEIEGF